jgi:hypothetical protein
LPDLHDDFAEAMPLPFSSDYTMTPEKAKLLIANMKPQIVRIVANYEQSGNGEATKGDQEDKDNASGRFNLDSCTALQETTRNAFCKATMLQTCCIGGMSLKTKVC